MYKYYLSIALINSDLFLGGGLPDMFVKGVKIAKYVIVCTLYTVFVFA